MHGPVLPRAAYHRRLHSNDSTSENQCLPRLTMSLPRLDVTASEASLNTIARLAPENARKSRARRALRETADATILADRSVGKDATIQRIPRSRPKLNAQSC